MLFISAGRDEGLEELKELLAQLLRENKTYLEKVIPYTDAGIIQQIRKNGELLSEEYVPEGILVKAYIGKELSHLL